MKPARRSFLGRILLPTLVFAPALYAQPRRQTIWGVVSDRRGKPIAGAVVKLKNEITLHIRSYITDSGGEYRFVGLHPELDYSLRARLGNQRSQRKTVTQFNNRDSVRVDLEIRGADANPE